jgi:purine-binding chemotaxis protein CheW
MTKTLARSRSSECLVLAVRLGKDTYGIPLEAVECVLPALPIEAVPQCPEFLRGVVFVRGRLIPILDGAERLGLKDHQSPLEPHIVCLRLGDRLVGLQVDEALDLVDIGQTEKLTLEEMGARRGFFFGVVDLDGEVIRLLNTEHLLAEEEAMVVAKVSSTS